MATNRCPLNFKRTETVYGTGFAAEVEIQGRVLAVHEEDGFWFYGVRPAAVAAFGATPDEGYLAFREAIRNSLCNLAELAGSLGEFQEAVSRFMSDSDQDIEGEWALAVAEVRSGQVEATGIKRGSAETPWAVSVRVAENEYAREAVLAA